MKKLVLLLVIQLRCSHAWIEAEAADALATLRAIAAGPGSPASSFVFRTGGAFRFFRVEETGLVGLSRDGTVTALKTRADGRARQAGATRPVAVAGTAAIPPVQAPPAVVSGSPTEGVVSSKNPDGFFSCSPFDEGSHVGEKTSGEGNGDPGSTLQIEPGLAIGARFEDFVRAPFFGLPKIDRIRPKTVQ